MNTGRKRPIASRNQWPSCENAAQQRGGSYAQPLRNEHGTDPDGKRAILADLVLLPGPNGELAKNLIKGALDLDGAARSSPVKRTASLLGTR
jgi:hypothetical protein